MKPRIVLIIIALSSVIISAQKNQMKPYQRLEQLEKAKLIEVLDIDEETAIKFFARRNENQKVMRDLMKDREAILKDLENNLKVKPANDNYYVDQVTRIHEIEKQMALAKEKFIKSLTDLLNPQQIAKLAVFEFKFRREVAQTLMGKRNPKERP
jgi:hypothetical protein